MLVILFYVSLVLRFEGYFEENALRFLSALQAALPPLVANFDAVECVSEDWVINNLCAE